MFAPRIRVRLANTPWSLGHFPERIGVSIAVAVEGNNTG
jgi:hypothetical protein